jgi:hypothetical protein
VPAPWRLNPGGAQPAGGTAQPHLVLSASARNGTSARDTDPVPPTVTSSPLSQPMACT